MPFCTILLSDLKSETIFCVMSVLHKLFEEAMPRHREKARSYEMEVKLVADSFVAPRLETLEKRSDRKA